MNKALIGNIVRFVLLVLSQVFIFNKIQITGFINPQVYVLFLLMLPYQVSGFWLLTLGFFTGLSVDFMMHTPGMHAASSVFMVYCRPAIIRLVGRKDDVEPWDYPNVRDSGSMWFLAYTLILVFLHHTFLFFLEIFRFSEFLQTMLKILANTALTTVIIMVIQYLFYSRKNE